MNLKELEQGIFEALLKGQMAAPPKATGTRCPNCHHAYVIHENQEAWAAWIQELGIYIYEFTIRFKQKKLKFEEAKRKAWWAMTRRVRDETVARIMNVRLPHETEGLYTVKPEEVCECGKFKSPDYPQCPACAEKRYEGMDIRITDQPPSQGQPPKEQGALDQEPPGGTPSS